MSSITGNVLRLGEGCLTERSNFAECFWQLLPSRCYVLGGLSALNLIYNEMLPKDKANELVNTMLDKLYDNGSLSFKRILHARAVECAKVLADEMLHQYTTLNAELINGLYRSEKVVFWQAVRTELDYVQS